MRSFIRYIAPVIVIAIILSIGCRKKDPIISIIPSIYIKNVDPTIVTQFIDSIIIILAYEDGDGDLGHLNPDTFLLWIKDNRLTVFDKFHVAPLAPDSSSIPIRGEFRVKLYNTFLLGNGGIETTTYDIKMRDRAGNWSNLVRTETITIKPK